MGRTKNYDRKDVLEQAMKVFWKKGYEGTNMKELMAAMKLSKFSIYNEFKDKEDLFHQSLKMYIEGAEDYYNQTLNKQPLGIKNIKDYFRSIKFEHGYYGCFYVRTLADIYATPTKSHAFVKNFTEKVVGFYLQNIQASVKDGDFSPKISEKALAQYFASADLGLAVFGVSHKNSKEISESIEQILLPINL